MQGVPTQAKMKISDDEVAQTLHRQKYELEVAKFIFSNNLPFSVIDPLVELLKAVKKDDIIRQSDFSKINRKLISVIGSECLAKTIKHNLEHIMDNRYFCLLIDEVSDGCGNGYLGLSIKWLDDNLQPVVKLYRLINLDCSAEKITSIVVETILVTEKRKKISLD